MTLRNKIKIIKEEMINMKNKKEDFKILDEFPPYYEEKPFVNIREKKIFFYRIENYGIFKVNITDNEIDYYALENVRNEEDVVEIIKYLKKMSTVIKLNTVF